MPNPRDYGLDDETLEKARQYFKDLEKENRAKKKNEINMAQALKRKLSVEQKIQLLNTAYEDIPYKFVAGMTKRPQIFNSVHMEHPNMGGQHESFGARLLRTRDMLGMSREELINICNMYASVHDKKARKGSGRKQQRTRITKQDIINYEDFNVCPKRDKLTVLAKALGVDISYLTGYGEPTLNSSNQIVSARYRKSRKKNYTRYTEDKYMPFMDTGEAQ